MLLRAAINRRFECALCAGGHYIDTSSIKGRPRFYSGSERRATPETADPLRRAPRRNEEERQGRARTGLTTPPGGDRVMSRRCVVRWRKRYWRMKHREETPRKARRKLRERARNKLEAALSIGFDSHMAVRRDGAAAGTRASRGFAPPLLIRAGAPPGPTCQPPARRDYTRHVRLGPVSMLRHSECRALSQVSVSTAAGARLTSGANPACQRSPFRPAPLPRPAAGALG
ncbi:unnamed protein product, partial [Iphiclides podalirius]